MSHVQALARVLSVGASLVAAALALAILDVRSPEDLGTLRAVTLTALPLSALLLVVGALQRRGLSATVLTLTGLGLCVGISAVSSDRALSGASGPPLATLGVVLSLGAYVLWVAAFPWADEPDRTHPG